LAKRVAASALKLARLRIFHPDKMFGLSPLSELASQSFGVIFAMSALVATWLVGARLTDRRQSLFAEPGHVAALVSLVVLGPCAVLLPLTQAHLVMERGKQAGLARISSRAGALSDEMERLPLSANLSSSKRLRADSWPIKARDVSAFPIGFLTPVWIALAGELVKRLAQKYGARPEDSRAASV
jgi:hypothetical protein